MNHLMVSLNNDDYDNLMNGFDDLSESFEEIKEAFEELKNRLSFLTKNIDSPSPEKEEKIE